MLNVRRKNVTIEAKQQRLIERYNDILNEAEDRIIDRINRSLAASFQNLMTEIRKKYPQVQANTNLFPHQRKLLLLAEMKDLVNLIEGGRYQGAFEELLQLANQEGITLATELMNAIEADFTRAVASIPLEAVRFAAEEQTRYLNRYGEEFANKTSAIVEQGLIQGWGVPRLQDAMMGQLGITKIRAEMISRTASVSAGNAAMISQYQRNNMDGFIWVATVDRRVCGFCAARNGQAYDFKAFRPPLHPRDRCFTTPYKESWAKKGLIDKNWYRKFRADGIEELRKQDLQPNYGVSSFERLAGITQAPTSIWKP